MTEASFRKDDRVAPETPAQMAVRHVNEFLRVPVEVLDKRLEQDPEFVKAIDLLPLAYNLPYQFTCGFTVVPKTSSTLRKMGQSSLVQDIRKGLIPIPPF